MIRDDHGVLNLFNQTSAKNRRGNTEDEIVSGCGGIEVRLDDVAAYRIDSTGDHEQIVHAAVTRCAQRPIGVGQQFESRFAHRAGRRDEKGNRVGSAVQVRDRNLRISERARPASGRLRMAAGTFSVSV